MLKDLILENEAAIERFELTYYLTSKNYAVAAALSALETTNEVQKSYFKLQSYEEDTSFNVLKLYAFLQSLFVSVDSLYALALTLTKSKNFININKNPNLRELKYIRNDVVGHPANRVFNATTFTYCILNNQSVTHSSFAYQVYSGMGVEERVVQLEDLVYAYYTESNTLLAELYHIALEEKGKSGLISQAGKAIEVYLLKGAYEKELAILKELYLKKYPNATSKQHRVLWRFELIDELEAYWNEDMDILELKEYAVCLEMVKIYELLSCKSYDLPPKKKLPKLVSAFYRLLKKEKEASNYINKIVDLNDPLFLPTIDYLLEQANKESLEAVKKYLFLLKDLYEKNLDSLLYAFALPIKEYKKKSKNT